ncbi:MAG: hypothetical protein KDB22_11485 [Planctomycetales bacterium]|nr:hypothetical protein [Planctomycetales bacterium]
MDRRFIIGIGTGRCGTRTLACMLNSQPNTCFTHELRPLLNWDVGVQDRRALAVARVEQIFHRSSVPIVGDVASFYLPYLEDMLAVQSDMRVIWLTRPKDEVVASFRDWLQRTEALPTNHWQPTPWRNQPQRSFHSIVWSRIFPKYQEDTLEKGIERYWNEYNELSSRLCQDNSDRFFTLATDQLNDCETQQRLFEFCGIDVEHRQFGSWHENASHNVRTRHRNTTYENSGAPGNCVILVPFETNIPESCEAGLRDLENNGYEVRRFRTGEDEMLDRSHAVINALCDGFLETMWINSDVQFHATAVDALRALGADVACMPVFRNRGTRRAYSRDDQDSPVQFGLHGKVIEVDSAGFDFLHVRRHVYEEIAYRLDLPLIDDRQGEMVPFFVPSYDRRDGGNYRYLSPAEAFSRNIRQCDFKILADCRVRVWGREHCAYGWEDSGRSPEQHNNFTGTIG